MLAHLVEDSKVVGRPTRRTRGLGRSVVRQPAHRRNPPDAAPGREERESAWQRFGGWTAYRNHVDSETSAAAPLVRTPSYSVDPLALHFSAAVAAAGTHQSPVGGTSRRSVAWWRRGRRDEAGLGGQTEAGARKGGGGSLSRTSTTQRQRRRSFSIILIIIVPPFLFYFAKTLKFSPVLYYYSSRGSPSAKQFVAKLFNFCF
jgi:hypothetical protein